MSVGSGPGGDAPVRRGACQLPNLIRNARSLPPQLPPPGSLPGVGCACQVWIKSFAAMERIGAPGLAHAQPYSKWVPIFAEYKSTALLAVMRC